MPLTNLSGIQGIDLPNKTKIFALDLHNKTRVSALDLPNKTRVSALDLGLSLTKQKLGYSFNVVYFINIFSDRWFSFLPLCSNRRVE